MAGLDAGIVILMLDFFLLNRFNNGDKCGNERSYINEAI